LHCFNSLSSQQKHLCIHTKRAYQQPFIQVEKSDINYSSLHQGANVKSKMTAFRFGHNTFNITSKSDLERLTDRLLTEHGNAIEKSEKMMLHYLKKLLMQSKCKDLCHHITIKIGTNRDKVS
jgi:hypothetical protein